MFETTIPFGDPELMTVSAFRRYLNELAPTFGDVTAHSTRLSSLSPSLTADLMRFERDGAAPEVLEVLAACVRHARPAALHLDVDGKVVPLTVFPQERLVHCPVDTAMLLSTSTGVLPVLQVEAAVLRPPGDRQHSLVGAAELHRPLGPLLWALALHGSRADLLPEIAGPAAYRVAPGLDTEDLSLRGLLLAAVRRLQSTTSTVRDIALWPGFDRSRATRLLNGLYLQSSLIVSRTHPGAFSDAWFGSRGR